MNIAILGSGRWGSFIAYYLHSINHKVTIYGRPNSNNFQQLQLTRQNNYVQLHKDINLTTNTQTIHTNDLVIISIPSQHLRETLINYQDHIKSLPLLLCMKGIDQTSLKTLTQVTNEVLSHNPTAVWLGPGHPQDFLNNIPNAMTIDSLDNDLKTTLVNEFSSPLIRFYYGVDLIGNEIGAAMKNVTGIAAGILDGLNLTALKGALLSRGPLEVSRLIEAMGGNPQSAYGLCHLGDYEATVFSKHSNNRKFGESIATNQNFNKLAEGYFTTKAAYQLSNIHNIYMPITHTIYNILFNYHDPQHSLNQLFLHDIKQEF